MLQDCCCFHYSPCPEFPNLGLPWLFPPPMPSPSDPVKGGWPGCHITAFHSMTEAWPVVDRCRCCRRSAWGWRHSPIYRLVVLLHAWSRSCSHPRIWNWVQMAALCIIYSSMIAPATTCTSAHCRLMNHHGSWTHRWSLLSPWICHCLSLPHYPGHLYALPTSGTSISPFSFPFKSLIHKWICAMSIMLYIIAFQVICGSYGIITNW